MRRILAIFSVLLITSTANAQRISGIVIDSSSGEPLAYATVLSLPSETGAIVNEQGYYSIDVGEGDTIMEVSYVGFATKRLTLPLHGGNIGLKPLSNKLKMVEVRDRRIESSVRDIGVVRESVEQLNAIPQLLGGKDVLKSIQLYPGISGGGEGMSTVIVRGGGHDQNLFLLDGVPIYNTNHAFGFLSAINPDYVKSLEVYKGGIPAKYGGRLSAVVNIVSEEGNYEKHEAEATMGLLLSSFKFTGPIQKGKTTYLLTSRFSYSDLVGLIARAQYNSGKRENYSAYHMFDYNLRFTHAFGDRSKLSFSTYQSLDRDIQRNRPMGSELESLVNTEWRNKNYVLRYSKPMGNAFLHAKTYYSQYEYNIENVYEDGGVDFGLTETSSISDLAGKVSIDWSINEGSSLSTGMEYHRYGLSPQEVSGRIESSDAYDFDEITVYGQWQKPRFLGSSVDMQTGLRLSSLSGSRFLLEPRLSFSGALSDRWGWKASYDAHHQYLHQLLRFVSVSFVQYWLPSQALGEVQRSDQIDGGVTFSASRSSQLDLEVFYKRYRDLIELRPGVDQVFNTQESWREQYVSGGEGNAYGLSLGWKYQVDGFRLQANYSYTHSRRRFTEINGGRWYEANFNKRHEVNATVSIPLDYDKWTLNLTGIYQTGRPFTLADRFYIDPYFGVVDQFVSINNDRLPAYKRLDAGVTRRSFNKNGRQRELSFGFYNIIGAKNFYFVEPIYQGFTGEDPRDPDLTSSIGVGGTGFFQFIPFFNYKMDLW